MARKSVHRLSLIYHPNFCARLRSGVLIPEAEAWELADRKTPNAKAERVKGPHIS
jgi:hypothetical protein